MRYLILFALATFILQITSAQDHTFPPVNEVSKDPSLEKFVKQLKSVIDRKDKVSLIPMLDSKVSGSVDGDDGVQDFLDIWEPDDDSTRMWYAMGRAIEMGGAYTHDTADESGKYQFVFPYTYNIELDIDDDYYYMGVITGKNVNLRKDPDPKSAVLSQLTYDAIRYEENKSGNLVSSGKNEYGGAEWYLIQTLDKKREGWVNWKYVYSLMGPRLFVFKNNQGQWKISAFLEGD